MTNKYRLQILPVAQKEIDKLPTDIHGRVISLLKSLPIQPRPRGCRKLKGTPNAFRLRIGEYRIIFRVLDNERLVSIGRVLHRSKAYKKS